MIRATQSTKLAPTGAAKRAAALSAGHTGDACAGIAFTTGDGKVLFVRRSDAGDHPGEWALPGGHVEDGENALDAARREAVEELGAPPAGDCSLINHGGGYSTFGQAVDAEFEPELNHEHTEFKWAHPREAPQPLHPGVRDLLPKLAQDMTPQDWKGVLQFITEEMSEPEHRQAHDGIAFDRAASVRTVDQDGRLHVSITNISKANICEYLGSEIPGAEEMGLDAKKLYKLLRDPAELEKAAPTFNNIPLLSEHVPVSADDPQKDIIVGSTGTDAVFEAPFLKNSLVIWDAEAIAAVESREKQELSCAYHYVPDMTPGSYQGSRYDGVMREIRGNHVAIVAAGRAGSDVVVGDSKLNKESINMSKPQLSRKATLVKGALIAFLCPRLAADASIDLDKLLAPVTSSNWKQRKPGIVASINSAVQTKKMVLAQDASIDGLVDLLDGLDGHEAEIKPNPGLAKEAQEGEVVDADPIDEILEGLRGKIDDAALNALGEKLRSLMKPTGDKDPDEPPLPKKDEPLGAGEEEEESDEVIGDDPGALPGMPEKITKKAMDAALAKQAAASKVAMDAAVRRARDEAVATVRAIAEAEAYCHPLVGKMELAFDSAEAVYKAALETMGVSIEGLHPTAYRAVLEAQPKPGENLRLIAQDSASPSVEFTKQFPDGQRLLSA